MSRPLLKMHVGGRDARDPHVQVSLHALGRYQERVCPDLHIEEAWSRLASEAARHGELVDAAPDWVREYHGVRWWLVLSENIAMPVLRNRIVPTCLTRGCIFRPRVVRG